jgi:hypothetical protein
MKTRRAMKQRNIRFFKEPIMSKFLSPLAVAAALLSPPCLGGAGPAQAASSVTFVSGKGTDSDTCESPAKPCRTFQFAIGQTSAGGEVKALDPAHYGAMTITKSISITGVEGAGRTLNIAKDAVTINAGPNDVVNLSHLTLDGVKTAERGIVLNSGGSLTITHCVVRNFKFDGIRLQPTGATKFLIGDTLVSDNAVFGVGVTPQATGSAQGTLDHVSANKNGFGMFVDSLGASGGDFVTAVNSAATNNTNIGFAAQRNVTQKNGVLRLAHSVATGNGTGVEIDVNGTVFSFGDNDIHGNSITDVRGTLTPVPKK